MKLPYCFLTILLFVFSSSLFADRKTFLENQLPPALYENEFELDRALESIEVMASIHPDLIYYAITYLNLRYDPNIPVDSTKDYRIFYNTKRGEMLERRSLWYDNQLDKTKGILESKPIQKKLEDYFRNRGNEYSISQKNSDFVFPIDSNKVNYYAFYYSTKEGFVAYDSTVDYTVLVEKQNEEVIHDFHDFSIALKEGRSSKTFKDVDAMLDYWYLYNNDGTPKSFSFGFSMTGLIADYLEILYPSYNRLGFSFAMNLDPARYTIDRSITLNNLHTDPRVVGGFDVSPIILTLDYAVDLSSKLMFPNTLRFSAGMSLPLQTSEVMPEGSTINTLVFGSGVSRVEEFSRKYMALENIQNTQVFGSVAVSVFSPKPWLKVYVGGLYVQSKWTYDLVYDYEYTTYLQYSTGSIASIRDFSTGRIVEPVSETSNTAGLNFVFQFKPIRHLEFLIEANSIQPNVKLSLVY
ncbi:MAG: hypothetical protein HQ556_04995 [Candidatus Marinimicrobia bacterium]|nr:hypothetical protein [Candidatus Neomarinimicrobiota bacterium]